MGVFFEDVGVLMNLWYIDLFVNVMCGVFFELFGVLSEFKVLYLGEFGFENKNDFAGSIFESWWCLKLLKLFLLVGNLNIGGMLFDWLFNNLDLFEELMLLRCGLIGEILLNVD